MKAGTRLLASLSLCAVATMLAGALATLKVKAAGGNPSANIDQCANGPVTAPVKCTGIAWQNGNANAGNAHWAEGESIAYRVKFGSLAPGSTHQITIQWDTTKGGKHAIDYLTSYNRTEKTGNDPCSGVSGCGSPTTFAIPPDVNTGLNLPPQPGSPADGRWDQVFTMYNGTITSVQITDPSIPGATVPYNLTGSYGGDSATSITITFTSTSTSGTPVLAWGGHIASRKDWGATNSAVAITGSPFHMRVLGLDGVGGNQDRGLSSSAVIFPAILTITKNVLSGDGANLTGSTPFNFTSTGPSTNNVPDVDPAFTLVNDGVTPPAGTLPANQKQFKLFSFGTAAQYTIIEASTTGFGLNNLTCTATLNGVPESDTITEDPASATATIVTAEGQEINCTFVNQQYATLTVFKKVVKTYGGTADASAFTVRVTGDHQTNIAAAGSETGTVHSIAPGTYTVSEDTPLLSGYKQTGFSGDCDATGKVVLTLGGSKKCTITNHDVGGHLIIKKVVDNTFNGTKRATDFSFSVNGGAATAFTQDGAEPLKGLNNVDVLSGSFNVVESATPIAGYATTYDGCSGTIANDETKTCTITNIAQSGTLIVQAIVINDNGGSKQATQLSFQVNGGAATASLQDGANVLASKNTLTETPGTYTVTAPALTGYTLTYNNCANVVIANQATETCTITFDDQPAHLIINKVVVNNNGGSLTAAAFSGTIGGAVVASGGNTWSGASTDRTLTAIGSYSVAENAHPGYDATFSAECTGTIALGETRTCTITNDDQPAHLVINKLVVNNNGGTLTASAFSGTIGGAVVAAGGNTWSGASTDRTLTEVGSYSVAENAHPGYDATFSAECSGTIGLGETKTCTVTNDDQPAHLIINKVVINDHGGSATAAAFSGTVSGVTAAGGATSWTGASTDLTLTRVGSYSVAENAHPGYDATLSAECSGTIGLGDTKTCTVTNDDQPAHLIINKVVVNDDGGSLSTSAFSGTIGGAVAASGGNTWAGASTDRILTAIGSYSVAENAHPGYDATLSADCSGTIGLGETKTCTVTNNDQPAHLTINKVVINNDGGSLTAAAFSGTVGGGVVAASGNTWAGASTTLALTTVGSYSVAENAYPGYTATFSADCAGTIAVGETRTCTVTNDDQAAHLVINKAVVNDNGGSATAAAFSGTVSGVTAAGGAAWAGASTTLTLTSVGSYSVAESPYVGYDATFSTECAGTIALGETKTCTVTNNDRPAHLVINKVVVNNSGGSLEAAAFSGTIGGAVVAAGGNTWSGASTDRTLTAVGSYSVAENVHPEYDATFSGECSGTIALGETKTCTVTNDDQAAHLIINKVVINDHGGSATAADFSGTISGVTGGATTWTGASTALTLTSVGSYSVAENAHPGYDATFSAECSGTIALGQTRTCTVTNNDQPAHLIVNKVVVNDNGGSLTAAAFSGTIGGTVVASGGNTWAGASTDRILTAIGSYSVAENAHPGYDATLSADCSGTIGLGETKTCTVTNNDQPARLIINVVVVDNNGGSLAASAVAGTVGGAVAASGGNTWTGASTTLTLTVVGSYNVAESAYPGYLATFSTDCAGTIALGETKTCTITNDDQPARLTLIKHVNNSNGGSANAGAFTLTAIGSAIPGGWQSVPGTEAPGVTIPVNAGYYSVIESSLNGYKQLSALGCEGTLVNGGSATCTITNGDTKARPTAATTMSWVLHDSLIVNGIRSGASGATVRFKLYGPDDSTCAGSVINGNGSGEVQPVQNGRASTASGFDLQQAQLANQKGTYRWIAEYSGDNNNNPFATKCGDETHTITVLDPPLVAAFINPVNGATQFDGSQPMTWTPIADAQAYYLYVGTSRGAKDLVDSGELQRTSYQASGLPVGQLLYARLWTRKASLWRYTDITFTAASAGSALTATVMTPGNGATRVDPTGLIEWTSVPNAEKYYVFVGSAPGANDLIDSQEICNGCVNSPMVTFWSLASAGKAPAQGLGGKAGQIVFVRLWTMVNGTWRYIDSSFTLAP